MPLVLNWRLYITLSMFKDRILLADLKKVYHHESDNLSTLKWVKTLIGELCPLWIKIFRDFIEKKTVSIKLRCINIILSLVSIKIFFIFCSILVIKVTFCSNNSADKVLAKPLKLYAFFRVGYDIQALA